jgi:mono/diheme cytochrome c family protein
LAITFVGWVPASAAQTASAQTGPGKTGAELYEWACAACHGPDGKGMPRSVVGFKTPLPDFSDCSFTTSEPDVNWMAVSHLGGPARALDQIMPAFDEALSYDEIKRTVDHVRGFCTDPAWPRGDLNLPRALATEKAFPENEAFVITAVPTSYTNRVETRFVYEHRIGARSQYEVIVPFNVVHGPGRWNRGLGDIAFAFKHAVFDSPRHGSIFSAGSEVTFPTGKEQEFLGNRLTIFEPFGTFSQILPHQAFLHLHAGFEFPLNIQTANNELFWRVAVGKTFTSGRWGRAWSPIVEVLGVRELAFGDPAFWDLLPELHVTLSRRQHISVDGGLRVPLNLRRRSSTAIVSILWDWYEGGLFSGW